MRCFRCQEPTRVGLRLPYCPRCVRRRRLGAILGDLAAMALLALLLLAAICG